MSAELDPLLPLDGLPYAEQLVQRHARVEIALRRAGIDAPVAPVVPSPRERGARARVSLRSGPKGRLGFHRPRSHDFVEVDLTALARGELVREAARLTEVLAGRSLRGSVELRTDGTRTVVVLEEPPPVPDLAANLVVRDRTRHGESTLTIQGLRVSARSFFQVNLEVNDRVVAHLDAWLERLGPARILDLYAGVGNLSARAIRRGVGATLYESEGAAARDARFNLKGADVKATDAAKYQAGSCFFDVAILDPPRAGAPGLLPQLALTRPRAILYLSCEPTNLARDIRPLVGRGYRVAEVTPFDMFPGTTHIETLCVLERV